MITEEFKKALIEVIKNLPDYAKNQEILILVGMELLARHLPGNKLQIKITRCNFCGECCLDYPNAPKEWIDDEGKCIKLVKDKIYPDIEVLKCCATYHKPYSCLHDPNKLNTPDCCIEYKEVDIN